MLCFTLLLSFAQLSYSIMASEEGDLNRWRELSGLEAQSSHDELINQESSCSENIQRVRVEGDTYFHQLSDGQTISVQHEADKVNNQLEAHRNLTGYN